MIRDIKKDMSYKHVSIVLLSREPPITLLLGSGHQMPSELILGAPNGALGNESLFASPMLTEVTIRLEALR